MNPSKDLEGSQTAPPPLRRGRLFVRTALDLSAGRWLRGGAANDTILMGWSLLRQARRLLKL
jgi:hypothetical protein